MSTSTTGEIKFGPFEVTNQVFYKTSLCYGLVNLKPLYPGHVLVIPFRQVQRLTDLTPAEVSDFFSTVQKVQKMLARQYFKCTSESETTPDDGSFNIAIQDGKEAGQTVPHLHCHIIPRPEGHEDPDQIYTRMHSEEGNVGGAFWDQQRPVQKGKLPAIEDKDREPRSAEVMNREAALFREQMKFVV